MEPKETKTSPIVQFGPDHEPPEILDLAAGDDLTAIVERVNEILKILREWGLVK